MKQIKIYQKHREDFVQNMFMASKDRSSSTLMVNRSQLNNGGLFIKTLNSLTVKNHSGGYHIVLQLRQNKHRITYCVKMHGTGCKYQSFFPS